MLGAFLLPLRHLSLDHARIDPVAARVSPLPLHLPEQALIPRLKGCRRLAVTFRQAAFQDLETPVNDNRSGSRFTVAAASNISDRITKWPSDNA